MSIKESALATIQTIADTDFIRAVTSLGASRKVLASDVGKYVLEDYAESELGGEQQSVKDAVDNIATELGTLDNKANTSGSYPALTAGDAEQVLSTDFIDDSVPYLFRQTAGGAKVGNRLYETIVGGTVAWNQLQVKVTSANTYRGVTRSAMDANGKLSLTGTKTDTSWYGYLEYPVLANHKVLFLMNEKTVTKGSIYRLRDWSQSKNITNMNGEVYTYTSDFTYRISTSTTQGEEYDLSYIPQFFDLTQMFGSAVADYIYSLEQANAGAGVAFFRSLFPKAYYSYNAGELISVKTSAHKTIGFNQLDEEWELGGIDSSTGVNFDNSTTLRTKNYIGVLPSTTYYYKNGSGVTGAFRFYDANKNFISGVGYSANRLFDTPPNCHYMRLVILPDYGTTYKNDICINISDASKNGTYEPYVENTYPLDSVLELRGTLKLDNGKLYYDGDTYESSGLHTENFILIDLGSVNWNYVSDGAYFRTGGIDNRIVKIENSNAFVLNGICPKYSMTDSNRLLNLDKVIASQYWAGSYGAICIRDSSYTDAPTFKTAMSGVYLVCERATPTTETADPFTSPQIPYTGGTEQYVDERDVAIPVGHNSQYSIDLRSRLEALPDDLSMIAPVEKGYTATQNYSVGAYLIVGNNFYKVTSAIANGGAITPGTNVTATTVATELIALR